jgi:hypothetical protein
MEIRRGPSSIRLLSDNFLAQLIQPPGGNRNTSPLVTAKMTEPAAILIQRLPPCVHEVRYAGAVPLPNPLGICAKIHVD